MGYKVDTTESLTKGRQYFNLYVFTTAFTLDIDPSIRSLVLRVYPDTIATTSPAARRFQDGWIATSDFGTATYTPATASLDISEVYGDTRILDATTLNAIDAPKLCDLGVITVDTSLAYDIAPSRLTFKATTGTDTWWVVEVVGRF